MLPSALTPVQIQAYAIARSLSRVAIGTRRKFTAVKLIVPRQLHFGVNHDGVCEFVEQYRTVSRAGLRTYLDFTEVAEVGPGASLYLAAEIDRWRMLHGYARMRAYDLDKWDQGILQYMSELGLFELLRIIDPPSITINPSMKRILRIRSQRLMIGDQIVKLRDDLVSLVGRSTPTWLAFYDGVIEAIGNVVHHAYSMADPAGCPRMPYWWLTAGYDPQTDLFQVVCADQGVGIPNHLPVSTRWGLVSSFLQRIGADNDAKRIEAALEVGRSSTNQSGRGLGFGNMMELVDQDQRNWLRVLSGNGECRYENGQILTISHNQPISGTMIQWTLALP